MACYSVATLTAKLAIRLKPEIAKQVLDALFRERKMDVYVVVDTDGEVRCYFGGVYVSLMDGELSVSHEDAAVAEQWRTLLQRRLTAAGQALVFEVLRRRGVKVESLSVAANGYMVGTVKVGA